LSDLTGYFGTPTHLRNTQLLEFFEIGDSRKNVDVNASFDRRCVLSFFFFFFFKDVIGRGKGKKEWKTKLMA
jgi:hypothetical protein